MFAAATVAVAIMAQEHWVPARWPSNDPSSLDLLAGTPVNCLLVDQSNWSAAFNAEAFKRGVASLAVVRPGAKAAESARQALDLRFAGLVFEGDFNGARPPAPANVPQVDIGLRSQMKLDGSQPVIGTFQGLWPGVRAEEQGATHAAASGAAWIDTNAGFLRFARAATPDPTQIWIAIAPPPKSVFPTEHYLQSIGDAAMAGGRWVLAFDEDLTKRLFAREARALRQWARVAEHLRYYESHPEWRKAAAFGQLALIQSAGSGALVSGGVLDMIAVKHTPVRPVPSQTLKASSLDGAQMAVTVDPDALGAAQKDAIRGFTRGGGTVLTGPPGWRFPGLKPDQITLGKEDTEKLDQIWKELNSMIGRRNLGARLYNVSTMLSNLLASADQKTVVLHLVNYSDYPAENVTVHLLGKYKSATLHQPGAPPVKVELYATDEGVGLDVDRVASVATVVLEPQL